MKKIKFPINLRSQLNFVIDPSITLEADLKEMIDIFKIKLLSYQDDAELVWNLYKLMDNYFSKKVKEEILYSCLYEDTIRDLKIRELILD